MTNGVSVGSTVAKEEAHCAFTNLSVVMEFVHKKRA